MTIHTRKSFSCPCCGNPIGEASPVERILDADLTRQQRTIIGALSERVGDWVRVNAIENLIWETKDTKRPIDANRASISVQVSKAQSILKPLGWFIASDRRGCYRLIPLEKTGC